jgi:hypothetical protein
MRTPIKANRTRPTDELRALSDRLKASLIHTVKGNERLAVTLLETAANDEIGGQKAPSLGVPMHAGSAEDKLTDRQRSLIGIIAEGESIMRGPLEQTEPDRVVQFVLT